MPASRLAPDARLLDDPEDRIRHARGHSLPDWLALRSGRVGAVPDAVARPPDAAAVADLFALAERTGAALLPYGGGTSVVGGVTTLPSDRPIVSVDLGESAGLHHLDETSGLATFGAGTTGPALEAVIASAAGQGVRGAGLGCPGPRYREPVVRHDRDGQHDDRPLHRTEPLRSALPGGDPRRVDVGGPGLSRLLDGRVVQARVRRSGGRARRRDRRGAGDPVR